MIRIAALAFALAFAVPASARTFVFPHFLEKAGFISNTQYTFDTSYFMSYSAGLAGTDPGLQSPHFETWLFDSAGNPLKNQGTTLCGPCTFDLSSVARQSSIRIESVALKYGAFDEPLKQGYAIVTVPDGTDVGLTASLFNSHTSASDLASLTMAPTELKVQGLRMLVATHLFEPAGSTDTQNYAFDTTIHAAYVGGQAGVPGGSGAALDFYWYADDSSLMKNNGSNICGPCTYNFGPGFARKASIKLEDLVLAQGAFDAASKTGFGVLLVRGDDPDGLVLTAITTNSHSGPFDLTFAALDLVPVDASSLVGTPDDPGFVRALAAQPNPSRDGVAFTFELARAQATSFAVYDALGRKVRTLSSGMTAAGAQRTVWDGKDDGGAQVAPGVYFGKLVSGEGELASKVVVLP